MQIEQVISYEVSIVIPIYNGSSLLEKHLTPLIAHLDNHPYKTQIILVDDGSPDRDMTSEYAKAHGLVFLGLEKNKGKGAALRKGFQLAEGNIQLFTDADIPFQYQNIDTLITLLRQDPWKLIIGDRTDPLSVYFEKTSPLRNLGSNLVSALVDRCLLARAEDSGSRRDG